MSETEVVLENVRAITLFVEDAQAAKRFDEHVFDARLVYEDDDWAAFDLGNIVVNLREEPAARDLVDPAEVAARGLERGSS